IDRIECSKISMAVYFPGYVDPTTGIMDSFAAWDKDGELIDCNWYFTDEPSNRECMVWTNFKEPMDPADIYTLTYQGRTIFTRQ
ncbi:MAG: hypothetical protein K6A91_03215, partial [Clostridia bacterium]|nr:hypothetical protein [Clostridia bacterium]